MGKIVSNERWNLAQTSEQKFWNSFNTPEILKNHEKAYKKEIKIFSETWKKFIPLNKKTKILKNFDGEKKIK